MPAVLFYDEYELSSQLKAGNKAAFTHLFELYGGPVSQPAQITEDRTSGRRNFAKYLLNCMGKRETITINLSTKGYLFCLAENKVHDFFGKLKRHRELYHQEVFYGEYSQFNTLLVNAIN